MTLTEECKYIIELGYYLFLENINLSKEVDKRWPYWAQDVDPEMGFF